MTNIRILHLPTGYNYIVDTVRNVSELISCLCNDTYYTSINRALYQSILIHTYCNILQYIEPHRCILLEEVPKWFTEHIYEFDFDVINE